MHPEFPSIQFQHHFFFFLLIVAAIVTFLIIKPFLSALVLAASFAVIFRPLYRKILVWLGDRKSLASLLTILLIVIIILLPFTIIGGLLFDEARDLYFNVASYSNEGGILVRIANDIEGYLHRLSPDINIDITNYTQSALEWALSHLNSFFSQFVNVLLDFFIMIIALFFLFRDGDRLTKAFLSFSPLLNIYDKEIIHKVGGAVNSVIKGSLIIAIVQGLLTGIGAALFGLPNPVMWGTVATLSSLIPGIGTALVLIPAIVYLFLTGSTGAGIGLIIWGIIVVGLVDNFLAPYIINKGMKIHPFFILIAVLGGIALFGPIGFLLGPIVLAFLFALLDIYPQIVKPETR